MKEQEQPNHLSIDVEQWRNEIRMFVQTTSQALEAIADEISAPRSNENYEPEPRALHRDRSDCNTIRSAEHSQPENEDMNGDDRITALKKRLEQRISS